METLRRCGSDHGDASARMGSDGGHNASAAYDAVLRIGVAQVAGRTPAAWAVRALLPTSFPSDSTRIAVIDTWATCGLPTDFRQFKVKHAAPSCRESPAYDTQDVEAAESSRRSVVEGLRPTLFVTCERTCVESSHGSTPGAVQEYLASVHVEWSPDDGPDVDLAALSTLAHVDAATYLPELSRLLRRR